MKGKAFFITFFLIFIFVFLSLLYCGTGKYEVTNGYKYFDSKNELIDFIIEDDTDLMEYSKDFDCEKFAITLQNNAMKKGYIVNVIVITGQEMNKYFDRPDMDYDDLHAVCGAICNTWKGYEYVYIEPQTDEIKRVGFLE